jgi:hypothetical protein
MIGAMLSAMAHIRDIADFIASRRAALRARVIGAMVRWQSRAGDIRGTKCLSIFLAS